jgi:hypothetical protein
VLFRPLTKLRVVTAVKNILDPAERTRVDKSGFPDSVVLVQISETNELAAPAPATVAAASTSEENMAGAAPSSNTTAAAVIMVESDDSDDEPLTKKPKTSAPAKEPLKPVIPTDSQPAAAKKEKTAASSTHPAKAPAVATAKPYVLEHCLLDDFL